MGKISKGILGPVSGTVGTVVGGSWKGIYYLRSKSSRGKRAFSAKAAQQQKKFGLVTSFLRSLTPLLRDTFASSSSKMSGFNAATAYTLKNAVKGDFPDYSIDFSLVLVSRGSLPGAVKPVASVNGTAVHFTWQDNSGTGNAVKNDPVVVVVYSPAKQQALFITHTATRSSATVDIDVSQFRGDDVHTYIAFLATDASDASDSLYTGKLTMPA